MAERAHLSIGEVLTLLQEEFPDVTISKIRFLESQGLLDPERTPSGYRKFYEPDIERLRWILRQQRENFLPLKVIKDRLDANGGSSAASEPGPDPEPLPARTLPARPSLFESLAAPEVATAAPPTPAPAAVEPDPPAPEPPSPEPPPAATAPPVHHLDAGPTAVSLTRDELASACGLSDKVIADLERFGLIAGRPMGRDTLYDEDALVVARLAAGFTRFGVEARHLRMYKVAADREAAFIEQVVLPLVKQRNPSARRQAVTNMGELASLGADLRAALLRQGLKGYTT